MPPIWIVPEAMRPGFSEQTHHGVADGRLAGAGFAHERVNLARLNYQGRLLDRGEDAAVGQRVLDPQVVDCEDRRS